MKEKSTTKGFEFYLDGSTKEVSSIENSQSTLSDKWKSDIKEETKLFICMIIFNEIMSTNADLMTLGRSNTQLMLLDDAKECQRTIVSLRDTRSMATAYVNSATDKFLTDHKDCKRVFGVDAGCLWEDYMCIATQQISCTGTGCNVPYGEL